MALSKITADSLGANAVTANSLSNTAITTALGFTPANLAGDTFTGDISVSKATASMYINSTTPGNNQNLWFRSNGSDTFGIEAQSNTGGSGIYLSNRINGGTVNFRTTTSGGSLQTVQTIDGAGRVTKPYNPSFVATMSATWNIASPSILPFDTVSGDGFDVGGNYNTSTYRFTAPVAGKYFFGFQGYMGMKAGSLRVWHMQFFKNGSTIYPMNIGGGTTGSSGYEYHPTIYGSCIVNCAAGDYIQVNSSSCAYSSTQPQLYSGNDTRFFGYLIG